MERYGALEEPDGPGLAHDREEAAALLDFASADVDRGHRRRRLPSDYDDDACDGYGRRRARHARRETKWWWPPAKRATGRTPPTTRFWKLQKRRRSERPRASVDMPMRARVLKVLWSQRQQQQTKSARSTGSVGRQGGKYR